MDKEKIIVIVIGAILALVIAGAYVFPKYSNSPDISGVTAVGGICKGSEPTTQLCNVNTYELESQTAVTSATGVFSSTLAVSGVSTFSNLLKVSATASSTVKVGSTADGVGPGCLILGDSGSATATPVYITATGATLTATTTRPAICSSN